jgi:hypothetical protein
MTLLGRTEVLIPASALQLLFRGLQHGDCGTWRNAAQGISPSRQASPSLKPGYIDPKQISSSSPALQCDPDPRSRCESIGPSDQCCSGRTADRIQSRRITDDNSEAGPDAGAVEALWRERSRAAEARAEAGGRALSLAWERDRKSLEQVRPQYIYIYAQASQPS